jgi:hypothetical protein
MQKFAGIVEHQLLSLCQKLLDHGGERGLFESNLPGTDCAECQFSQLLRLVRIVAKTVTILATDEATDRAAPASPVS